MSRCESHCQAPAPPTTILKPYLRLNAVSCSRVFRVQYFVYSSPDQNSAVVVLDMPMPSGSLELNATSLTQGPIRSASRSGVVQTISSLRRAVYFSNADSTRRNPSGATWARPQPSVGTRGARKRRMNTSGKCVVCIVANIPSNRIR